MMSLRGKEERVLWAPKRVIQQKKHRCPTRPKSNILLTAALSFSPINLIPNINSSLTESQHTNNTLDYAIDDDSVRVGSIKNWKNSRKFKGSKFIQCYAWSRGFSPSSNNPARSNTGASSHARPLAVTRSNNSSNNPLVLSLQREEEATRRGWIAFNNAVGDSGALTTSTGRTLPPSDPTRPFPSADQNNSTSSRAGTPLILSLLQRDEEASRRGRIAFNNAVGDSTISTGRNLYQYHSTVAPLSESPPPYDDRNFFHPPRYCDIVNPSLLNQRLNNQLLSPLTSQPRDAPPPYDAAIGTSVSPVTRPSRQNQIPTNDLSGLRRGPLRRIANYVRNARRFVPVAVVSGGAVDVINGSRSAARDVFRRNVILPQQLEGARSGNFITDNSHSTTFGRFVNVIRNTFRTN